MYRMRESKFTPDYMVAVSAIDGSFIGSEAEAKRLTEDWGIAPQARPGSDVSSIGFCEKEQKWYGWSHRAIYGFGIGSTVKRGDCGYVADTPEGLIESRAEFFADISEESAQRARDECQILADRSGIRILHAPMILPMAKDLEDALGHIEAGTEPPTEMIGEDAMSIIKCGRGEWTAKTLDDAKQMAMDFAESVS